MSTDQIKQALEGVRHPIASSSSLPPPCYHEEDWFRLEMERVFRRGWLGIGRRDQWKRPGDYETIHLGNIAIVVIMDEHGALQAMSNSCLHRSSQIMSGHGNCRAMVCPFHGWSYDYSGRLVSASRMENAPGFSEKGMGLKKFHVATQDGFVFLNLEENPGPLDHWLGDFSEMHAPWSLEDLVTGRQRVLDVDCNWKLFLEVFNEYYHLPYVHPESISHYYPEPDPADDVMGEYTTQFGPTTANPALLEENQGCSLPQINSLGEREKGGARYTWVYPNMTFAAGSDCLWMYHVYPLTATRTRAVQTVCFPSQTTRLPEFRATSEIYYSRFDIAINEDIPALEKQQAGMESPFAVQGRFSALEPSVGNFACWYAAVTR